MKETCLHARHLELNGRMVDFSGWSMPVQYAGIVEEHRAVREAAGLFDVSHMGEIAVTGPDAASFVAHLVVNDTARLTPGRVMYAPMCYESGGVVDDIVIYMRAPDHWLLVVNAANNDKDADWIGEHAAGWDVEVADRSDDFAQIAVQGPKAQEILQRLTETPLAGIPFYGFREGVDVGGVEALVSRTGYTGEDGFELYCVPDSAPALWDKLLETGRDDGIEPAGLGARDTLRFEACLPLYGHELTGEITPLEAGIGMFVKVDKGEFIGREALRKQKEEGVSRKIVGLEMLKKGVPRHGYPVLAGERSVGEVTSGSYAPTVDAYLALALVDREVAGPGTELAVDVRGRTKPARVVKKPFYRPHYKK